MSQYQKLFAHYEQSVKIYRLRNKLNSLLIIQIDQIRMNALLTLWKFSRPSIIGSVISILTLYYIVCEKQETQSISYLVMALSIGVTLIFSLWG
ncbi:MAG: hypothetical protein IPG21_18900 [Saprospiraceae bacterium]|nr:hypothetical protein [Candidatus Vicinibacter affinis]